MLGFNESDKNNEWLRRRKLRLEQVRKQSSDVAKHLRERMAWDNAKRVEEEKKLQQKEFIRRKVKALSDLERKYRSCISEIGMGHKLANEEADAEEIISEKKKINLGKAMERGKHAVLQKVKERKEANEKKLSPVRRKKITRELEDIRSNLVCSLPKKQVPIIREEMQAINPEGAMEGDNVSESTCSTPRKIFLPIKGQQFNEGHIKKVTRKTLKKKKKKLTNPSEAMKNPPNSARSKASTFSRTKGIKSVTTSCTTQRETEWINLNDIKTQSTRDSETRSRSSGPRLKDAAVQPSCENFVEFYNFPSRYYCKSYKECESLIERIDCQTEPDAVELARQDEEEQILEENKKRENEDVIAERGNKALTKEKLKREYSDLMSQLEKLSKEERKIKSNRRIPPPLVHMTDERLAEVASRRQRNMDSKFEAIYHNLVEAPKPAQKLSELASMSDKENTFEDSIPQLNVAQSPNLKTTSPIAEANYDNKQSESEAKSFQDDESSKEVIKYVRKKVSKRKQRKDLIQNIEKTLEKSRKIRKEANRIVEKSFSSSSEFSSANDEALEKSENNESVQSKSETEKNLSTSDSSKIIDSVKISVKIPEATENTKQLSPIPKKSIIDRISPKKDSSRLYSYSNKNKRSFLEDSLPLTSSTCYRSPPSELQSGRIGHLIDFLTNMNINESGQIDGKFRTDVEKLLNKMSKEDRRKEEPNVLKNPELSYYISKLLGMSRDVIANLNVSSVSEISTPYITDLESTYDISLFSKTDDDFNDGSSQAIAGSDSSHFSSFRVEDKIRAFRLKQAEEIDAKNKEWRRLLEDKAKFVDSSFDKPLKKSCGPGPGGDGSWKKTKTEDLKKADLDYFSVKLQSPRKENNYEKIANECSQRISELSEKLEQVRKEKEKLLNSSSGSSFSFKLEKSPKKDKENRLGLMPEKLDSKSDKNMGKPRESGDSQVFSKKGTPPALEDFTNRYRLSPAKAHHLSTILEADSQMHCRNSDSSTLTSDSIPNIMDELFQKKILTSPFHWSGDDTLSHLSSARDGSVKKIWNRNASTLSNQKEASSLIHPTSEFVGEGEFRPLYIQTESEGVMHQSFQSVASRSSDKSIHLESSNQRNESVDNSLLNSLDNMNQIVSKLGLKWAKPLLKKNEDLTALSTSSNSDRKQSPSSCRKLNFETERSPLPKSHKKRDDDYYYDY